MANSESIARTPRGVGLYFLPLMAVAWIASLTQASAQDVPDPTFNPNAWMPGWHASYFLTSSNDEEAKAIARTSDGSYVVAGRVFDPNSYVGVDIGLVKYGPEGELDPMFGGLANVHGVPVAGQIGEVLFDAYLTDVTDMTIDSLGRIIVVGPAPTGPGGDSDFAVVRFLADGSGVDTSFGGDGGTVVGFNYGGDNNDIPVAVLTDEQDRVAVVGNISSGSGSCSGQRSVGMTRLTANGALDTTFGYPSPPDGHVDLCAGAGNDFFAEGLLVFRGHYAIAATYGFNVTQTQMALASIPLSGDLSQFGSIRPIPLPAGIDNVRTTALALQSPSELIIAGNALDGNNVPTSAVVCRIDQTDPSGGNTFFDPTFGPGCYVSPSPDFDTVSSVAVHSDRSVVLVGDYMSPLAYPRGRTVTLNADGAPLPGAAALWQAPRDVSPDLSFRTSFVRVILDNDLPVIVGYRSDDSGSDTDHDFVTLRIKPDRIFANGFD